MSGSMPPGQEGGEDRTMNTATGILVVILVMTIALGVASL